MMTKNYLVEFGIFDEEKQMARLFVESDRQADIKAIADTLRQNLLNEEFKSKLPAQNAELRYRQYPRNPQFDGNPKIRPSEELLKVMNNSGFVPPSYFEVKQTDKNGRVYWFSERAKRSEKTSADINKRLSFNFSGQFGSPYNYPYTIKMAGA